MNTNAGDENLINAMELVARMGRELNGLSETLTDLFQHELNKIGTDYPCQFLNLQAPRQSSRYDDSQWLCTGYAESFALSKQRASSNEIDAHVGYQISLLGDGLIPGVRSPLIHVFFWEGAADFDSDGHYLQFPLGEDATCSDERLLKWEPSNSASWIEGLWAFSIKLTSMNSRQDLLDSVVSPALALLRGKGSMDALPDSLTGLVLYPTDVVTYAE